MTKTPEISAHAWHFDGGLVLLNERTGRLFVYEGSAADAWDAVAAGCPPSEILAAVGRTNATPVVRAFEAMFAQWFAEGLLDGADAESMPRAAPKRLKGAMRRWRARLGPLLLDFASDVPAMEQQLKFILGTVPDEPDRPDARFTIAALESGAMELRNGPAVLAHASDDGMIRGLVYQACLDIIHRSPPWLAHIHGAVIGHAGKAIALPALSGSGKTTLTAWLITRGFDFLADDLVAVRGDGHVAPWPMPISVKSGSMDALAGAYPELATATPYPSRDRMVRQLPAPEGAWRQAPLPLSMFVFPTYDSSGQSSVTRLRPLECLTRLVNDRLWLGSPLTAGDVWDFLSWLPNAPAYAIRYGDLPEAEALVREILANQDIDNVRTEQNGGYSMIR